MAERRTPIYDYHLSHAGKMVKGGGDYMFPITYTSPVEEHENVRTNVGLQDLTSMGQVDIQGPGAERLVSRLLVGPVFNLHPGQIRYATICTEDGLIVDDVTAYKFNDEHFMIVTSSAPRKDTYRWISEHAQGMRGAYVNDLSGAIALLSVQGPRSRDFLQSVAQDTDTFMELRFFRFCANNINGTELLISRSGYTGELGYELYVPAEEAMSVWDLLLAAGQDYGLLPYGVTAMQSLRIEKALPLAGPDINGTQNPFQVGLGRWIDFKKREFVGRDALLQMQDQGLSDRWIGLTLDSNIPARHGDPIYSIADISTFREKMFTGAEAGDFFDREIAGTTEIGYVTSSAKGHSVGHMLALGYVSVSHSWPGANMLINIDGRPTLAQVTNTPFFDAGGNRMRAVGPRKVAGTQPSSEQSVSSDVKAKTRSSGRRPSDRSRKK